MPEGRHVVIDRLTEEAIIAYEHGKKIISFNPDQDEWL